MKAFFCSICGKEVGKTSNIQKYCKKCSKLIKNKRSSKYYNLNKKRYLSNQKKGNCIDCNTKINKKSIRCLSCYHKTRRLKKGHEGKEYNGGDFIKYCGCGCGGGIFYKKFYSYHGIPRYLFGHHPSWNKGLTKENRPSIKKISESKIGNNWNNGKIKVIYEDKYCKKCGKKLKRKQIGRGFIYCSIKCFSRDKKKELVWLGCTSCNKEMTKKRWTIRNNNFCSKKCFKVHISNKLKGRKKSKEFVEGCKKRRAKQIFPVKDSTIEVKIQNFLKKLGIEFFTHQYMKIEHGYLCDILIPSINLVIECDGDYWHGNPIKFANPNKWQLKQIEKDKIRTQELFNKGYGVLRLWEKDIRSMRINCFKKIMGES